MPRPQIRSIPCGTKPLWLVIQFTSHPNCQRAASCRVRRIERLRGRNRGIVRPGARNSAVTPREPAVKRVSRDLSPVFSWNRWGFTPCGKPARAGRWSRIGGRRTLHVSRFNRRLTNQANHEGHGALLLFSVPNRRLTNQTSIETRNLFFLRKEVIQPQVPLRLPCSCVSTIRMAAWTISSSLP